MHEAFAHYYVKISRVCFQRQINAERELEFLRNDCASAIFIERFGTSQAEFAAVKAQLCLVASRRQ
jgi:hypothetical protein